MGLIKDRNGMDDLAAAAATCYTYIKILTIGTDAEGTFVFQYSFLYL